eukprot:7856136-Ditylum_brightwellii.AAC.1
MEKEEGRCTKESKAHKMKYHIHHQPPPHKGKKLSPGQNDHSPINQQSPQQTQLAYQTKDPQQFVHYHHWHN